MAALIYNIKPYQIKKIITQFEQGGSITLDDLLEAVEADVLEKLPEKCIECVGTAKVDSGTRECPTCKGYGRTELPETMTKTISKNSPAPTVTL